MALARPSETSGWWSTHVDRVGLVADFEPIQGWALMVWTTLPEVVSMTETVSSSVSATYSPSNADKKARDARPTRGVAKRNAR